MAAAFRSIASTTYASRANTSVAAPSGIVDNDILIAGIFIGGSGTPPTPTLTGFTQIGSATSVTVAGFNGKIFVFWKRAASESGAYAFSHTTDSSQAFVMAVSGCVTSGSPVDVNSTNSGTGLTSTATGVTTTAANDFLLYIAHDWEGLGALNPPTGFTERLDGLLYTATALQASAGASGNKTQTNGNTNGSEAWAACLIALKEATASSTNATVSKTLDKLTASGGATAAVSGAVAKALGLLTCSGVATAKAQAQVAATLADIAVSAIATAPESASVGGILATLTAAAAAEVRVAASLTVSLESVISAAAASACLSGVRDRCRRKVLGYPVVITTSVS